MGNKTATVSVRINCDCPCEDIGRIRLANLVRMAWRKFGEGKAQIDIAIAGDAAVRKLNSRFLKSSKATDVISFELSDRGDSVKIFQLAVNIDMARRQALRRKHTTEAELALYIVHGLLHNLGFNDNTDTKAKKMHQTEDRLLQQAGFGSVYHKSTRA